MDYAHYIGRVGALAVALGVGMAITASPGVAIAEQDSGASSGASDAAGGDTSDASGAGADGPATNEAATETASSEESESTPTSLDSEAAEAELDQDAGDEAGSELDEDAGDEAGSELDELSDLTDPADQEGSAVEAIGTVDPAAEVSDPDPVEPAVADDTTASAPEPLAPADTREDNADRDTPIFGTVSGPIEQQDADNAANSTSTMSEAVDIGADVDAGAGAATTRVFADDPGDDEKAASTIPTPAGLDTVEPVLVTVPEPDPVSAILAFPAALFAAAVDAVVSAFEPVVGPGGPFEDAFLWGVLAWTRRITNQTFANRSPDIGADSVSLTVAEDSPGGSVGELPATDVDGDSLTYRVASSHGPANGTVDIVGSTVTYIPNPGYSGADTFTLVASDSRSGFHIHAPGNFHYDTVTVAVTVETAGSNSAPVAVDDTATISEDTSAAIDVLANDSDADSDAALLSVAEVSSPTHGTAVVAADGTSVSYTPDADFAGTDSFTYTAEDIDGAVSNSATVTVTVTPVDDQAVLGADTVTVAEDTTVTVDVLANDHDADGALTVTGVSDPAHGTAAVAADGLSVSYSPDSDFAGTDSFTYTVTDPVGGSGTGTVTVTVVAGGPNTGPVASPTIGVPDADGVVTGDLGATDPDGDPLSYVVTVDADSGMLTLNADGTFTYTPTAAARVAAAGTPGPDSDSFTVEVSDGVNPAVAVTVDSVPILAGTPAVTDTITGVESPIGVAVSPDGTLAYITNGGAADSISVIDTRTDTVIDTIPVGDGIREMVLSPDGDRIYLTRTGDQLDSIGTLVVVDTASRAVTGTEIPVGYNPEGVAVSPNGSRVYVANVYGGDVSVIDTATDTVIASPQVGSGPARVAVSPDGTRAYVTNSFDGTVSVIDTATNTVVGPPIMVGDSPFGVTVSADGSRAYVANADGDSVSVIDTDTAAVTATIGVGDYATAVALSPDGSLAYVANYSDDTVSVIDTATEAVVATVALDDAPFDDVNASGVAFVPGSTRAYATTLLDDTVSVISLSAPADTPAVIGADTAAVDEDTVANPIDVLANDSDDDGPLSVVAVSGPANGTAAVAADGGSVTYTPDPGFTGTDSFTYTAADPFGGTGTGTVTVIVTVADGNEAPEVDPVIGTPDPVTGRVVGTLGATDQEDDPLTYTTTATTSWGTLVVADDGTFTYTPTMAALVAAGQTEGEDFDAFTVEVSDGSNPAVVVTIDDLPVLAGTVVVSDTVEAVPEPVAVAVSRVGSRAYVTNGGDSESISVIDTATNTVIATVDVGGTADGVAVSPDGARVYVATDDGFDDGEPDSIKVIDTANNTVIATLTAGDSPTGVAVSPDGARVYVTNAVFNAPDTLSVIDTGTGATVATIDVGTTPRRVAVSPDGSRAYVTNNSDDTVSVVDTVSGTVVATVEVGGDPEGVAVGPDGTRVYVVNSDDNTVSVIDTATATVVSTITVGGSGFGNHNPLGVAISPDGSLAYVTNNYDGTVSVIDTATGTVVDTVTVGFDPEGVAFGPDGVAYVVNNGDDTVSVLSVQTTPTV